MKKTIAAFSAILASGTIIAAQAADWERIHVKKEVTVYQRKNTDSALFAFKGEGVIHAPVERVAAVIFDTKRAPEWVVDLEESKVIRWISKNEFIEYDHVKTPPLIMKDRDFLSRVKLDVNPKTKEMTFLYYSVQDPAVPEGSLIRGNLMNTTFVLTPVEGNTKTRVVGEIYCDPKGSVPKWLVNWFQREWPVDTLNNLRTQVAKTNIVIDDHITSLFAAK